MEVKEWYAKQLQGLSLRNVCIRVTDGKRKLYEEFGEMLFTHYGVTGPVILSASSIVGKRLKEKELTLHIDLKPALTEEQLDKRILREFDANHNKQFKNAVDSLFPAKLKPVMTELSGIAEEKKVNEITKEERMRFVRLIKDFKMTLTSLRSYSEAIITKGGVSVKEIDPGTMESKKMKGLYFAGEVLDLDAVTGGYNLQIAWSTGYNVAVDGPAGAGKSTIAKLVAKEKGYIYVDTGAMYRGLAIHFLKKGISPEDKEAVAKACIDADVSIVYENGVQQVYLNGENITGMLRTEEVGNMASKTSAIPAVREKLLELQKTLAREKDVIMDGRDIGTNILPNADVKIYLTASVETRAKRRYDELASKGESCDFDEIARDIKERDERDMTREIAPLKKAEDAILVDSSDMTID